MTHKIIYNIQKDICNKICDESHIDSQIEIFYHKHIINKYTINIKSYTFNHYIRLDIYFVDFTIYNDFTNHINNFMNNRKTVPYDSRYCNFSTFEINIKKYKENYNNKVKSINFIENTYKIDKWLYKPIKTKNINKQCIALRLIYNEFNKIKYNHVLNELKSKIKIKY